MKIFRIAQVRNVSLSVEYIPRADTEYISSVRLINTEGTSNKEYIIRIYRYPDGKYSTIAFSGRIGSSLRMQPKYFGTSDANATFFHNRLVNEKISKGYEEADFRPALRVLGVPAEELRSRLEPAEPTEGVEREVKEVKEKVKEEVEEPLSEKEIEEFERSELADLLGHKKINWHKQSFIDIPDKPTNWYEEVSDKISPELTGFFRFTIKEGEKNIEEYLIEWQGLSPDTKIIKHNMPSERFKQFFNSIKNTADIESLKAYKEVMRAYVGGE